MKIDSSSAPIPLSLSAIRIHKKDNVAVLLRDCSVSESLTIDAKIIIPTQPISKGHKIALCDIKAGKDVIKYGLPMGIATQDIHEGEHIHTHNVKTKLTDQLDYEYVPEQNISSNITRPDPIIQIYRRANQQVGIRNELWIIPTVGCVNAIAQRAQKVFLKQTDTTKISGVHVFTHPYGCSQLGDDHDNTKKILQNMVHHPNAGAVLVMGLGCENNQIAAFKETLGDYDPERVRFMVCQFEQDEHEVALKHLQDLYAMMQNDQRSEGRLSELKFGLECGGSDGLSGITANPLLGQFSDFVTHNHGTSVLTEVPEMFGAEQLLMNRAQDVAVFNQIENMINGFKQYFIDHNQPIYENPSPGNKAGGISTLEEKSLGCTQKSGNSPVVDVIPYGARLKVAGLNLLSAPGNDAVATTALAAAGCHMVLFSTGRGTPYGGFVPTVKLATNSALAKLKPHWIDFNAGRLLEGVSMQDLLDEFIDRIVEFANGELTCNEKLDFRELAIFKSGVTL